MNTPEKLRDNPFFTLFEKQQSNRQRINLRSVKQRIRALSLLEKALLKNRKEIRQAMYLDFKKPVTETDLTEIYPVLSEIRHVKANIRTWMRPERINNPVTFIGTKSDLVRIGKGVCLIISPWN